MTADGSSVSLSSRFHVPLVVFGVPFHRITSGEAVTRCLEVVEGGGRGFVATPNLDFVMRASRDPELYRILARADVVIADGMPIVWLAKVLGPPLPERVAGSDLVVNLAEAAAREGRSLFHLGGGPGVPEKAAEVLRGRFPALKVAGCYSPPKADLLEMDHGEILERLREAKPDILYVAFGAPKQEKWINMHLRDWGVGVALGIGGSLDFLAGAQRRAPVWMQKSGTEWMWRLGSDPKRLWRRYGANMLFLVRALGRAGWIRCLSGRAPAAWRAPAGWEARRLRWRGVRGDGEAEACVRDWVEAGRVGPVWVDFEGCGWLDSRELGVVLAAGGRLRDAGRALWVSGLSRRLWRWLVFNGLDRVVTRVESAAELEAMEGVGAGASAVEEVQGAWVLRPPGELTAATLPGWRETVERVWEGGLSPRRVRVEAEGMSFLDSAGLGALMGLRRRVVEEGGRFEVAGLGGAARATVKLARAEGLLCPVKDSRA